MTGPTAPAAPLVVAGAGQAWAWSAVEVTGAYDLSRRADFARLDPAQRLDYAIREQAGYVDRLLAIRSGEVAALRWARLQPRRLWLWLLARTSATAPEAAAARAARLAEHLLDVPSQVTAEPVANPAAVQSILTPFMPAPDGVAQVGKRVRIQQPERPDAGVDTYLAVEPFAQERVDWSMLLDLLAACPHPLTVTVTLTPEQVSTQLRRTLESEATRFARLKETYEGPADLGGRLRFPPDSAAAVLEPLFQDGLHRYADRAFRFSITVASPVTLDEMVVEALGRTISPAPSPAAGQSTAARHDPTTVPTGYATSRPQRTVEYEALTNSHATLQPVELPDLTLHAHLQKDLRAGGAGTTRRGLLDLRTLVDRAEALSLFRLPVALDGHVPGFPVRAPRDQVRVVDRIDGAALGLGRQGTDGPELRFAVRDLPRHGFVVGTPGSGKTNTALHLCRQLWADHRIPFLVVEPVNAELDDYRWLATLSGFDDLVVLTVGDESVAPLRLNPFEVPVGATVVAHISSLLACFEAAFGLWDPLPLIYRRALTRMYRRRGYHPDVRGTVELLGRWPVLAEFVAALTEVTGELGYAGEIGHNIDAAARLRAEALAEGACGATLDCRRSFDIGALVDRPVVVELAGVGDNAKEQALVTLLLLNAVRAHRRWAWAGRPHVMLLEEAHRIFPRATPQTGGDVKEANAQALAAERIAQGLAEDRKYGQGYVLIDQQVGKVAEDAYKITNLKVMHRTSAAEDRELLGATMSMHADQIGSAAALAPFEAVVSHNGLDRAVTVQVPDVRALDAAARALPEAPLADADELRRRHAALLSDSRFADAMAPYEECVECRHRCAFRRRAESVVLAAPALTDQVVSLAVTGPWKSTVDTLVDLAGRLPEADPQAVEDYRVCVFIHAMQSRYPLARRRPEDHAEAAGGTALARRQLRAHRGGRAMTDIPKPPEPVAARPAEAEKDVGYPRLAGESPAPESGMEKVVPRSAPEQQAGYPQLAGAGERQQEGLTGQVFRRPAEAPMPQGLGVHADGADAGGTAPEGHRTVYPTEQMSLSEFQARYTGPEMGWEWHGTVNKKGEFHPATGRRSDEH